MKRLNIPVGISDFAEIRQNEYYYVDKTGLILELLKEKATKVTLITRPRRFGKTLGMSMLASFFDIRKKNERLFQNLAVSSQKEICSSWMNQCPTIFFSMKDIGGLTFASAYEKMCILLANLFKEYTYLLECPEIDESDKKIFGDIKTGEAGEAQIGFALSTLMRMMHIYYGRPVLLLLDEYDVPLAKASSNGYYDQMLELIKTMMGTALKDNRDLQFAVITGCLKIAKESIFTGTNNMVSDTISSSRLNEYFGFTQQDVDQILKDAKLETHAGKVKTWYDGYHFGDFDIYCPWDVMNYVLELQRNLEAEPSSYWKNTSDNAIIRSFIDYAGSSITMKLETLLEGGYIIQQIEENLTYDYLHSSEDNLWSILYLTGYLTRVREQDLKETLAPGMCALMIPNAEIREIFETTVIRWFGESAVKWDRMALFHAVWTGDEEVLNQEMNKLLRLTISYHDYKEDFYHAFLAGIFAGAGYVVKSNRENGEGRSDVAVFDSVNGRVSIFEVKYSAKLKNLSIDCEKALHQIEMKRYVTEYEDSYDEICCYGIAFYKKRCFICKQ